MRVIKKVAVDTFVSVFAWTCEKCTSEIQAEHRDINALIENEKLMTLSVKCPVCSQVRVIADGELDANCVYSLTHSASVKNFDPSRQNTGDLVADVETRNSIIESVKTKILDSVRDYTVLNNLDAEALIAETKGEAVAPKGVIVEEVIV